MLLLACAGLLIGTACTGESDTTLAGGTMRGFFAAVKGRDWPKAASLYSPTVLAASSKEQARQNLSILQTILGDLQGATQTSWSEQAATGPDTNPIYVTAYRASYSRASATETFTLKRNGPLGAYAIEDLRITSSALASPWEQGPTGASAGPG